MKRGLGFILLLILLIGISFSFINSQEEEYYDVTKTYGPGDDLQGWIKMGFDKEPVSSTFEDSEGNSINIIDLLKSDTSLVEGVDYICSVPECKMTYKEKGEIQTFSLDKGESKVIGFKFIDEISSIESTSFKITSNAGPGCKNQLEIDFFADSELDYGNDKAASGDCSSLTKSYGCFDPRKIPQPQTEKWVMVGKGNMYCQRIKLSRSPGFKLGAWLNISSGANITKIGIYDYDSLNIVKNKNDEDVECELDIILGEGERFCEVDFLVTKSEKYYICMYNDHGMDIKTEILAYKDKEEGCGFHTSGLIDEEDSAYKIFAEGKMFDSVGTINITEDYPFEDGLSHEFKNYIYNTYGSYDCFNGCIVPIKLNSKVNQNITISDVSILYTAGGGKIIDKAHDLNLTSSTVSNSTGGHIQISLSNAGFTLPTKLGSFIYEFEVEGHELFKEVLLIESGPVVKSLSPSAAFDQIPINFRVNVEEVGNASIVRYVWEFGNITRTTTTNTISYAFPTEDDAFPVKITVTDSNGKTGSKTFQMRVDSHLLYFGSRVGKVEDDLARIESQISNFSDLNIQEGIQKTIDIPIIRQQIANLKLAYGNASTEQEYGVVINGFLLLESNVPESVIEKINTSSLSYYPNLDSIELGIVKEVLGGNYDTTKTSAYKEAVLTWSTVNFDSKVKYKQITAEYEDGRSEPILNVFELDLRKIGTGSGTLFIRQLENMEFSRAYGEQIKSEYVYIPLDSGKNIKFYTTQDIGITNLPAFISPALSELTIIEEFEEAEGAEMRWALFFLVVFFLLILAIIIYIVLQQWYKHKYETYLFKNRNFLFNLINYIDTQKKKGVKESEIFRKLKKAGWNSEQINYIIRKYLGKRTGMLELPVEKILKMFRKKGVPLTRIPTAPGRMGPPHKFRPGP